MYTCLFRFYSPHSVLAIATVKNVEDYYFIFNGLSKLRLSLLSAVHIMIHAGMVSLVELLLFLLTIYIISEITILIFHLGIMLGG